MRDMYPKPERMQMFQRGDHHVGPVVRDPLEEARKQRVKNFFTHLSAGLLWLIGIWATIIIVFWRLAQG